VTLHSLCTEVAVFFPEGVNLPLETPHLSLMRLLLSLKRLLEAPHLSLMRLLLSLMRLLLSLKRLLEAPHLSLKRRHTLQTRDCKTVLR
jgi:hypothetical protein